VKILILLIAFTPALAFPQIHGSFGFNAKGLLNTSEQVVLTDKMLSSLPPKTVRNIQIRVVGGSISQKKYPADWPIKAITSWIRLQRKHGFGLVYVVNGNDTPISQKAFIQKWISLGAKFTFIEMMNEYYLNKFRKGDTSRREVTKKISAQSYVNEILPSFIPSMQGFKLPLFIILAPEKPRKWGRFMREWNQIVVSYMAKNRAFKLGATIHLYKRDRPFNYAQIVDLRKLLPLGTPIAVTEAGVLIRTIKSYAEQARLVKDHYQKIAQQLRPGDFLFDQVLYHNYAKKNNFNATTHPVYKGVTPKGQQVLEFIKKNYAH